jgi:hypothetical protein
MAASALSYLVASLWTCPRRAALWSRWPDIRPRLFQNWPPVVPATYTSTEGSRFNGPCAQVLFNASLSLECLCSSEPSGNYAGSEVRLEEVRGLDVRPVLPEAHFWTARRRAEGRPDYFALPTIHQETSSDKLGAYISTTAGLCGAGRIDTNANVLAKAVSHPHSQERFRLSIPLKHAEPARAALSGCAEGLVPARADGAQE